MIHREKKAAVGIGLDGWTDDSVGLSDPLNIITIIIIIIIIIIVSTRAFS